MKTWHQFCEEKEWAASTKPSNISDDWQKLNLAWQELDSGTKQQIGEITDCLKGLTAYGPGENSDPIIMCITSKWKEFDPDQIKQVMSLISPTQN
jgi:hypothetical protein